jgi:peptidoglycan DL-endopeptidase CwlO
VPNRNFGFRRAPSQFSPTPHLSPTPQLRPTSHLSPTSLLSVISRSVRPATKASAAIVISGAMVASLALPASAATLTTEARAAAPATATVPSAAQAPLASRSFGNIGFTGVDKAPPVAAPVVRERTIATVSRSTTRVAVSLAPKPPRSGGMLGIAASLAGIYYVYGGTTPAGFDCSGFTQYVFGQIGIGLPRTAEAQRQSAMSVSNPQPGDLVFFGSPAYHVGIYAGNGMMWDSPHSGETVGLHSIWSSSATFGRA